MCAGRGDELPPAASLCVCTWLSSCHRAVTSHPPVNFSFLWKVFEWSYILKEQTQQSSYTHTHTDARGNASTPSGEIEMAWVCGGVNSWRCVGGSFVLRAVQAISPHLCRFRHDAVDAAEWENCCWATERNLYRYPSLPTCCSGCQSCSAGKVIGFLWFGMKHYWPWESLPSCNYMCES